MATAERLCERGHPGSRVPASILRLVDAGYLRDTSWHNDMCPSFEAPLYSVRDGVIGGLRLWVDYARRSDRELVDMGRYAIVIGEWDGDTDWQEADLPDGYVVLDDYAHPSTREYATLGDLLEALWSMLTDDSGTESDRALFQTVCGL